MAAVTVEHGWLLVHNRAVEHSTELLSWQWTWETVGKAAELVERQRLAYPCTMLRKLSFFMSHCVRAGRSCTIWLR